MANIPITFLAWQVIIDIMSLLLVFCSLILINFNFRMTLYSGASL